MNLVIRKKRNAAHLTQIKLQRRRLVSIHPLAIIALAWRGGDSLVGVFNDDRL